MRRLPFLIAFLVAAACLWSCGEDRHSFVANVSERVPTMSTTDVSTFISDSGYTRYHITTPLWQMFEETPQPYWRFPAGLHLEQYDENMRPAADVTCDSATYLSNRRLWQLDGNVVMVNTQRDSFLTQQLFWDQQRRLVYSDSFIHIVRADRIIEGYGFESNQEMTFYSVNRPTGIFAAKRPDDKQTVVDEDGEEWILMNDTSTSAFFGEETTPEPARRQAPVRASERNKTAENEKPFSQHTPR